MLQRIDELDQECEELKDKVMDIEGERDELRDILDETKIQTENLTKELAEKQVREAHLKSWDIHWKGVTPFPKLLCPLIYTAFCTTLQEQVDNINADRSNLSEAIRGLELDVQRLEHELQDSEHKMRMIVQHPGDKDSLIGGGTFRILMDNNNELLPFITYTNFSCCPIFCGNASSIRDYSYWTFSTG